MAQDLSKRGQKGGPKTPQNGHFWPKMAIFGQKTGPLFEPLLTDSGVVFNDFGVFGGQK